MTTVPKLDYLKALENPEKCSRLFREAMVEPGFLFLKNVPGYDSVELKKWTHWFYKVGIEELSEEERLSLKPRPYRGFIAAKEEAESSYKDLYEIGGLSESERERFTLLDATPFPQKKPEFVAFMRDYYRRMNDVALNLLRMLVPGDQPWIRHFTQTPFSTLRLIRYPEREGPVPAALVDGDTRLLCQPHTDGGFITLLAVFHQPGLEMLTSDGSGYIPVSCEEEGLFVNIGDLLASLVGGGVKATRHRVVDHGVERYSVPFFFEPDPFMVLDINGKQKTYGIQDLPAFREARPITAEETAAL